MHKREPGGGGLGGGRRVGRRRDNEQSATRRHPVGPSRVGGGLKKSQAFVLICMPKSNHFRVSVMIIIMLMM